MIKSNSLSRAVTRWSALVSGQCSPLVLYARPTWRDLSPTWVFQSCEIRNPKRKKKLIIRNNVHSYAQAHVHTRSYMHSHTRTHIQKHARTYCYTWFFLNLDYAQRDRRCRALHRCIVPPIHVFTDCYGEKKKEKRNNNKYSKAQTIRFNAFHYYILYV